MNSRDAVKGYILRNIRSGRYRMGEKIETIREIARGSNVSAPTVARAIHELVDAGLLRTEHGRGCFLVGTNLEEHEAPRPDRTGIVGLLLPFGANSSMDAAMTEGFSAIQQRLFTEQFNVLLLRGIYNDRRDYPFIPPKELPLKELSGLLVLGIYDHLYLSELNALGIPVVAMDVDASNVLVDSVALDHVGSAADMIQKLYDGGARRIAFLGGPLKARRGPKRWYYDPCAPERLIGWRAGLARCGLEAPEDLVWEVAYRQRPQIRAVLESRLTADTAPDAILTEFPGEVSEHLVRIGVSNQVKVACWDSKPVSNGPLQPDVVAVCDYRSLGTAGVDVLVRRLRGDSECVQKELISPIIQVRGESVTARPVVPSPAIPHAAGSIQVS